MNTNVLDEVRLQLVHTSNPGANQQPVEVYWQMLKGFKAIYLKAQEQEELLKRLANMAYEVKNNDLRISLEDSARRMNPELDILYDIVRTLRAICDNC